MLDVLTIYDEQSRAPHGARGLKRREAVASLALKARRAPHGARGLKLCSHIKQCLHDMSRPAWGAWIETQSIQRICADDVVAPRMGRVD